jgi:Asp-tRNA(Asn)/Glu-tRNA(Gln) amidotransferase A subunit family amidase
LEATVSNTLTAAAYDRVRTVAQELARRWIKTALQAHAVDVLVTGTAYTSNGGAAGIPALTVPAGLDAAGRPQGVILAGDYLSEPHLFALGFALEQGLRGRVAPDLHAAIKQIDALPAR